MTPTRGTEHQATRGSGVQEQRSILLSLPCPCVCRLRFPFLSHKLQFWQGRRPQLETWRASSPSFVRSWRRDQFFQLWDDRETGPSACRVRCCVSASMIVVGPFREMQCEQLVWRGFRHQLQFSTDPKPARALHGENEERSENGARTGNATRRRIRRRRTGGDVAAS